MNYFGFSAWERLELSWWSLHYCARGTHAIENRRGRESNDFYSCAIMNFPWFHAFVFWSQIRRSWSQNLNKVTNHNDDKLLGKIFLKKWLRKSLALSDTVVRFFILFFFHPKYFLKSIELTKNYLNLRSFFLK